MVNVMNVMWDISKSKSPLDIVNPSYKDKAVIAFAKGIDIILKTQISFQGKKAVWCAQHDEVTLLPALARSYELPSFSGSESVGIVRTLMLVENPSSEVIDAINGAINWFNTSKIVGYKLIDVVDGQPDSNSVYENGFDKILVESPGNVMWARFYDLDTNLPFFCSRDGIKKSTIAEISHERRNGYAWYGNWPASLISKDYPAWKAKHGL
jgi:PelA/Pel-15E family pectate lyase